MCSLWKANGYQLLRLIKKFQKQLSWLSTSRLNFILPQEETLLAVIHCQRGDFLRTCKSLLHVYPWLLPQVILRVVHGCFSCIEAYKFENVNIKTINLFVVNVNELKVEGNWNSQSHLTAHSIIYVLVVLQVCFPAQKRNCFP